MAITIDGVHQLQIKAENGDFNLNLADETARNQIDDLTQDLEVQTARIDNILVQGTPTEGNAELIDIRVGADGTIYPTAGDAVRNSANSAYVVQTESGNPIAIDDGVDNVPVKELIVNLEPKQSGSGDPSPSNVRQISGYDGVKVKRFGKNLMKFSNIDRNVSDSGITLTYSADTDKFEIVGESTRESAFILSQRMPFDIIEFKKGETYTVSFSASTENQWYPNLTYIDDGGVQRGFQLQRISSQGYKAWRFTVPDNFVEFQRFQIGVFANATIPRTEFYVQLELGSEATSYEPYIESKEYSITFPSSVGTVYGGTLNITTGLLTIDRYNLWIDPTKIPDNYIHFDVLTNNARIGNLLLDTHFNVPNALYNSIATFRNGAISNWLAERNKGYSSDASGFYFSTKRAFYLFCEKSIFATQDASGFKQYLTDNPLYICYVLETPLTYQLTPTEVSTLLGGNTISSDGSINLTYRADISKVIEKLTNAIISLGGNV